MSRVLLQAAHAAARAPWPVATLCHGSPAPPPPQLRAPLSFFPFVRPASLSFLCFPFGKAPLFCCFHGSRSPPATHRPSPLRPSLSLQTHVHPRPTLPCPAPSGFHSIPAFSWLPLLPTMTLMQPHPTAAPPLALHLLPVPYHVACLRPLPMRLLAPNFWPPLLSPGGRPNLSAVLGPAPLNPSMQPVRCPLSTRLPFRGWRAAGPHASPAVQPSHAASAVTCYVPTPPSHALGPDRARCSCTAYQVAMHKATGRARQRREASRGRARKGGTRQAGVGRGSRVLEQAAGSRGGCAGSGGQQGRWSG